MQRMHSSSASLRVSQQVRGPHIYAPLFDYSIPDLYTILYIAFMRLSAELFPGA